MKNLELSQKRNWKHFVSSFVLKSNAEKQQVLFPLKADSYQKVTCMMKQVGLVYHVTSDFGDPSQMNDLYHEMGRPSKWRQATNDPSQKITCITKWV